MIQSMSIRSLTTGALAAAATLLFATSFAQDGAGRTELSRLNLAGAENTEVIMAELELPPGASVPRHFHHGEEYLYVVQGGTVETRDGEVVTFEPGQSLHFKREEVHGGFTATGSSVLKVVTVHIVDKNKPLYVNVE
ncbi:MAG: cupin domain-containing protein [Gammaproteobacteria bacterium]|nr:cupin domain-containing protein [Gammaproteobacteria bacterium]